MTSVLLNFKTLSLHEYKTSTLVMFSLVMSLCSYFLLESSLQPYHEASPAEPTSTSVPFRSIPQKVIAPSKPMVIWHSFNIKAGMNLTTIFQELNLPFKTLYDIINIGPITKPLSKLKPNSTIDYALDSDGVLVKMEYSISPKKKLTIILEDDKYVANIIKTAIEQRFRALLWLSSMLEQPL